MATRPLTQPEIFPVAIHKKPLRNEAAVPHAPRGKWREATQLPFQADCWRALHDSLLRGVVQLVVFNEVGTGAAHDNNRRRHPDLQLQIGGVEGHRTEEGQELVIVAGQSPEAGRRFGGGIVPSCDHHVLQALKELGGGYAQHDAEAVALVDVRHFLVRLLSERMACGRDRRVAKAEFCGRRALTSGASCGAIGARRGAAAKELERRSVCGGEDRAVHKRLRLGADGQPLRAKVAAALPQQIARLLAADVGTFCHLLRKPLPQPALLHLDLRHHFALQPRVRAGDSREVARARDRLGQLALLGTERAPLCERPKERPGRLLRVDARSTRVQALVRVQARVDPAQLHAVAVSTPPRGQARLARLEPRLGQLMQAHQVHVQAVDLGKVERTRLRLCAGRCALILLQPHTRVGFGCLPTQDQLPTAGCSSGSPP